MNPPDQLAAKPPLGGEHVLAFVGALAALALLAAGCAAIPSGVDAELCVVYDKARG